jgi:hypothetical protein
MTLTPAFHNAVAYLNLGSQMKVKNNGNGRVESTIFSNGRNRFIHLIRYACEGTSGETGVTAVYRIPVNKKVEKVTGQSPYTGNPNVPVQWKTEGNNLIISTILDIYTMIRVTFNS